jgi:Ca-activated chloride channel family protein
MVTVANVQSFEDKIVHQDISFDGGKVAVTTTNNGENWDCIVKLMDQDGKVVASVRTYQAPKEMEVNPGIYNISMQALAMDGIETFTKIENIEIKSNETTPVSYNYKTGKAVIETFADGKSIDGAVNINEVTSGKNVSGGRTYGREKEFLLNPGKYQVKLSPLGNYKNRKPQTITIEVKQNETTSKKVNFEQ